MPSWLCTQFFTRHPHMHSQLASSYNGVAARLTGYYPEFFPEISRKNSGKFQELCGKFPEISRTLPGIYDCLQKLRAYLRRNRPPNEKRLCTRETLIKIHYNHMGGVPPYILILYFISVSLVHKRFSLGGRFLLKIGPEFL